MQGGFGKGRDIISSLTDPLPRMMQALRKETDKSSATQQDLNFVEIKRMSEDVLQNTIYRVLSGIMQ